MKKKSLLIIFGLFISLIFVGNVKAVDIAADGEWHAISNVGCELLSGCICKPDNNSIYHKVEGTSDGSGVCYFMATSNQTGTIKYGNAHTGTYEYIDVTTTVPTGDDSNTESSVGELVETDTDAFNICDSEKNPGVMAAFKIGSFAILIIKIIVPIILIVLGMIDMGKAVVEANDDSIKKNAIVFARRLGIGVLIFFVPTLLLNIFDFVDGWDSVKNNYADCIDCLFDMSKCPDNVSLIQDT